jgi:hypothetical protein
VSKKVRYNVTTCSLVSITLLFHLSSAQLSSLLFVFLCLILFAASLDHPKISWFLPGRRRRRPAHIQGQHDVLVLHHLHISNLPKICPFADRLLLQGLFRTLPRVHIGAMTPTMLLSAWDPPSHTHCSLLAPRQRLSRRLCRS